MILKEHENFLNFLFFSDFFYSKSFKIHTLHMCKYMKVCTCFGRFIVKIVTPFFLLCRRTSSFDFDDIFLSSSFFFPQQGLSRKNNCVVQVEQFRQPPNVTRLREFSSKVSSGQLAAAGCVSFYVV